MFLCVFIWELFHQKQSYWLTTPSYSAMVHYRFHKVYDRVVLVFFPLWLSLANVSSILGSPASLETFLPPHSLSFFAYAPEKERRGEGEVCNDLYPFPNPKIPVGDLEILGRKLRTIFHPLSPCPHFSSPLSHKTTSRDIANEGRIIPRVGGWYSIRRFITHKYKEKENRSYDFIRISVQREGRFCKISFPNTIIKKCFTIIFPW